MADKEELLEEWLASSAPLRAMPLHMEGREELAQQNKAQWNVLMRFYPRAVLLGFYNARFRTSLTVPSHLAERWKTIPPELGD
jgi:hypothetical protein